MGCSQQYDKGEYQMKKNHLREIVGDKIRWQYFTWPLLILLFCMILVPYNITDRKYLKAMLDEQASMGLIDEDDL